MIKIKGLRRRWGTFYLVVEDLEVPRGAHFALLGPCGAGKTLLLETITGHYRPDEGDIFVGGRRVNDLPPEKRSIGVIYQNSALFPNMSVAKNIEYGLRFAGLGRIERRRRAAQYAEKLGIESLLAVKDVTRLSGGEAQKVALARTLVTRPEVLLLDEPLHSLDRPAKEEILRLILALTAEINTTVIHVTHDFSEASAAADRCAVLMGGTLRQTGATEEVFAKPADREVADFLGVANCWPLVKTAEGAPLCLETALRREIPAGAAFLCVRPEAVLLGPHQESGAFTFQGRLQELSDRTDYVRVKLDAAGETVISHISRSQLNTLDLKPGSEVRAGLRPESMHFLADRGPGAS